jgi:hypothetical protein
MDRMNEATQRPSFDDLDAVMRRGAGSPRFARQKLEPVVLPPPPTHVDPPPAPRPASPEDDIEPDHEAEYRRRRAVRLIVTLAGCAAVAATAGYLAWPRIPTLPKPSPPPQVEAAPQVEATPPPRQAETPVAESLPPAPVVIQQPAPAAQVEALRNADRSELTAPATEGLSPPRLVPTLRIRVENDREVSP